MEGNFSYVMRGFPEHFSQEQNADGHRHGLGWCHTVARSASGCLARTRSGHALLVRGGGFDCRSRPVPETGLELIENLLHGASVLAQVPLKKVALLYGQRVAKGAQVAEAGP
jgi:hypothetical protein